MDIEKHRTLVFGGGDTPRRCVNNSEGIPLNITAPDGTVGVLSFFYEDQPTPPTAGGAEVVPTVGSIPGFNLWDGQPGIETSVEAAIYPDVTKTYTMVTWKGQNFEVVATPWENQYSPVINPDVRSTTVTLIDSCGLVVGYYLKKVATANLMVTADSAIFYCREYSLLSRYGAGIESVVGRDLLITSPTTVERYSAADGVRHSQITDPDGIKVSRSDYKYRVPAGKWADIVVDIDGFVRVLDTYGDAKAKSWTDQYNNAVDKLDYVVIGLLLPRVPTPVSDECWDDWSDDPQMQSICDGEQLQSFLETALFFGSVLSLGDSALDGILKLGTRAAANARATTLALSLELSVPEQITAKAEKAAFSIGKRIVGTADAKVEADAAREVYAADRFADRAEFEKVYLGDAAKKAFKSPKTEKFPDVVARKANNTFAVSEGKGTDMPKVIKQFEAAQKRLPGPIVEQEVVVPKLTDLALDGGTMKSPGPGFVVDKDDFLLDARGYVDLKVAEPPRVLVNGQPIKVVVMP